MISHIIFHNINIFSRSPAGKQQVAGVGTNDKASQQRAVIFKISGTKPVHLKISEQVQRSHSGTFSLLKLQRQSGHCILEKLTGFLPMKIPESALLLQGENPSNETVLEGIKSLLLLCMSGNATNPPDWEE